MQDYVTPDTTLINKKKKSIIFQNIIIKLYFQKPKTKP